MCVAKPDTILAWYRRLIAKKFDGSKFRSYPGRPRISREVTDLILQMAKENSGWGYDRIVGALANLGHVVSDQTVGNILRRHCIAPAPKRSQSTTWKDFFHSHMDVLAGIDFFSHCSLERPPAARHLGRREETKASPLFPHFPLHVFVTFQCARDMFVFPQIVKRVEN